MSGSPRGWNSVIVPGAVSAWTELHTRFGRLPFTRIFEPAIGYGRDGFLVSLDGRRAVGRAGARTTVAARIRGSLPSRWPGAGCWRAIPASRACGDAEVDRGDRRRVLLSRRARGRHGGALDGQRRRHADVRPGRAPPSTGSTRSASTTAATHCTRSHPTVREIVALIAFGILALRYVRAASGFRGQRAPTSSRRSSWPSPMHWPTSPTSTTCRCRRNTAGRRLPQSSDRR